MEPLFRASLKQCTLRLLQVHVCKTIFRKLLSAGRKGPSSKELARCVRGDLNQVLHATPTSLSTTKDASALL
eukprot:3971547-Amphidinium_carterae.1